MTQTKTTGIATVRCWKGGGPRNEVWNWGDAISPFLFSHVSGHTPLVVDYMDMDTAPHLMICGSTMKWVTPGSHLWGIGEISQTMNFLQPGVKPAQVAAVRGPLTRQRLLERDIDCPEIYCDPALLFPRFHRPDPQARKYRLGIVPHYIDQNLQVLERFASQEDVCILDITQASRAGDERITGFIDDICACDVILSSSLHGIILADAYGIPSRWMRLSDRVFGGDFKFRDYFTSMDQSVRADLPLTDLGGAVEALIAAARADFDRLGPVRPDLDAFLAAFPSHRKITDTDRWTRVAATAPPWDARNQLIAKHVPQGASVVEFGSGNQSLRRHVQLSSYHPVDCVPGEGEVFICDYNTETRFPKVRVDLVVMSGFLEYIVETEAFLIALRKAYPGTRCVFSWAFEPFPRAERLKHGWIAGLNPSSEQEAPFARHFDSLRVLGVHATPHTRQVVYEGVL